jgi:hypothetical protein
MKAIDNKLLEQQRIALFLHEDAEDGNTAVRAAEQVRSPEARRREMALRLHAITAPLRK